ncbi:hypothetical protein SDC9_131179 [bioreactor metagenome]|uniref:Uncharacterized protein n=1 Tax=bioreactor metagenome TaxID=1076179 RepID=A0A645D4V4_9ZZZZ
MGDVAHKALARRIHRLQLVGHVVKGHGKLRDLIVAAHRGAGGQIAVTKRAGGRRDAAQGVGKAPGQHDGNNAGQQQHHARRQNKGGEHAL